MPTIPGASRFLASSSLANIRGLAPAAPTLLDGSGGFADGSSLLAIGKSLAPKGAPGLSPRARAMTTQYLSQSKTLGNQILSLGLGTNATPEAAMQEILAMRSRFSERQVAPSLRGVQVDEEA